MKDSHCRLVFQILNNTSLVLDNCNNPFCYVFDSLKINEWLMSGKKFNDCLRSDPALLFVDEDLKLKCTSLSSSQVSK